MTTDRHVELALQLYAVRAQNKPPETREEDARLLAMAAVDVERLETAIERNQLPTH